MSQTAAGFLADRLRGKPDSLLILATGNTPERTYQLLVQQGTAEPDLCNRLRILTLDEWAV